MAQGRNVKLDLGGSDKPLPGKREGGRTENGDIQTNKDGSAAGKIKTTGAKKIGEPALAQQGRKEHNPVVLNGTFEDAEVKKHEVEDIMEELHHISSRDDDMGNKYMKHAVRVFLRCAAVGNKEAVHTFLKLGMSPRSTYTKFGGTALHHCCHKNQLPTLEMLLDVMEGFERTEAVNQKDEWGRIPLHIAAKNGYTDIVELLCQKNSKLEATDEQQMNTPLILAALNGHSTVCRMLLQAGADRGARTVKGESAYDLMKIKNPESSVLNQLAPDNQKDLESQKNVLDRESILKRRSKMTKTMDYCGAWVSDDTFVLQINCPGLNRNSFGTDNLRYERIATGVRLTGNLDVGFSPDLAGWSDVELASGKTANYMNFEHRWESTEFDVSFPIPETLEWKPAFIEMRNGRIGFRFKSAGEHRHTEAEPLMETFGLGVRSPEKKAKGGGERGQLSNSLPELAAASPVNNANLVQGILGDMKKSKDGYRDG